MGYILVEIPGNFRGHVLNLDVGPIIRENRRPPASARLTDLGWRSWNGASVSSMHSTPSRHLEDFFVVYTRIVLTILELTV